MPFKRSIINLLFGVKFSLKKVFVTIGFRNDIKINYVLNRTKLPYIFYIITTRLSIFNFFNMDVLINHIIFEFLLFCTTIYKFSVQGSFLFAVVKYTCE